MTIRLAAGPQVPLWLLLQVTVLASFAIVLILHNHAASSSPGLHRQLREDTFSRAATVSARVSLRGLSETSPSSYDGYTPKLHTLTVATYDIPSLHLMLQSNPNVTLLGMGEPWGGFRTKFTLMLKFLKTVHPDDVVLFVDAFDTLFLECDHDLLSTFLGIGYDIVFNAESNCWPEQWKAEYYPEYPGQWHAAHMQHKPRFLNSGVYMGRVKALLHFFARDFVAHGAWDDRSMDDQRFWVDLFLAQQMDPEKARNEPSIGIDYFGQLFQEISAAPFLPFYTWQRDPVTNYVQNGDGVYNSTACIMHAPGWMEPLWSVFQPRLAANETLLMSPELMRPFGDAWYQYVPDLPPPPPVNASTLLQLPVSVYGKQERK